MDEQNEDNKRADEEAKLAADALKGVLVEAVKPKKKPKTA